MNQNAVEVAISIVRLGDKITELPMHGGDKELKKGLVEGIKKILGLK